MSELKIAIPTIMRMSMEEGRVGKGVGLMEGERVFQGMAETYS